MSEMANTAKALGLTSMPALHMSVAAFQGAPIHASGDRAALDVIG